MQTFRQSTVASQGSEVLNASNVHKDDIEFFNQWLAVELAATLRGNKPSTILSFANTRIKALLTLWRRFGPELLENTSIQYMTLRCAPDKEIVLFYRTDILEQCILESSHSDFLEKHGYPVHMGIKACLDTLKHRFRNCCPHEVGVLLGIPLKDVLGFMGLTKLPLTCRGEWCIYGSPEKSLAAMKQYADDKSWVACLLQKGIHASEIMQGNTQSLKYAV